MHCNKGLAVVSRIRTLNLFANILPNRKLHRTDVFTAPRHFVETPFADSQFTDPQSYIVQE